MCGDHDFSSREGGNETRAEEAPKMANSDGWEEGNPLFHSSSAGRCFIVGAAGT
jgi:hypothetical protein